MEIAPNNLKLCVASRPWLVFEDTFKAAPWLRVEDLTRPDIHRYIRESLTTGPRWTDMSALHPDAASRLISDTAKKASGVFLWVVLVVKSLLDGLRDGDYVDDLFVRLDRLPSSLEELFRKILEQLKPEYFAQACELFQLVQAGHIPLTLLTISFALEGCEAAVKARVVPITDNESYFRADTVRRRMMSRCRGLLEAKDYQSKKHKATVQYLHRTVRDYFKTTDVEQYIKTGASNLDAVCSLWASYLQQVKVTTQQKSINMFREFWSSFDECIIYADVRLGQAPDIPIRLLDELEKASTTYWSSSPTGMTKYGTWMEEACAHWQRTTRVKNFTLIFSAPRGEHGCTNLPHWTNTRRLVDVLQADNERAYATQLYASYADFIFESDYSNCAMAKLEEQNHDGESPDKDSLLVRACRLNHFTLVKQLIECGANPNAKGNNYLTVWEAFLHHASSSETHMDVEQLCSLLETFSDHRADPRVQIKPTTRAPSDSSLTLDELLPLLLQRLIDKGRLQELLRKVKVPRDKHKKPQRFRETMKGVFRIRATSK